MTCTELAVERAGGAHHGRRRPLSAITTIAVTAIARSATAMMIATTVLLSEDEVSRAMSARIMRVWLPSP